MQQTPSSRKKNPNASLRNGFSYEDLVVLSYCLNWLNFSEELDWIEIQYGPNDKVLPGLDDVVIQKKNGDQRFIQVKHVQNPTAAKWLFNNLLEKGLVKWISSTLKLNENQSGQLFTNAIPDEEIRNCIVDGVLLIDQLKLNNFEIYEELNHKFSHEELTKFSNKFKFIFENPGVDVFEDILIERFWNELRLPFNPTHNLIRFIGKNGRKSEPIRLAHEDIKRHLDWELPRHLNQNFKIPSDFQLFNSDIHKSLLRELRGKSGGIKLISGKPGTGKSTYLSKLHSEVSKKHNEGTLVLRHHYHLNPEDDSSQERLLSHRTLEGLKAQILNLPNWAVGHLKNQNSKEIPLSEYIKTIVTNCISRGGTFILIIDGLDHVVREGRDVRELQNFLNEVYFPQKGYWIVLGTQPFIYKELPSPIKIACPKKNWIEIGCLSFEAVQSIASKNFPNRRGKSYDHQLHDIGRILFKKSRGNALYLRYIVNEIRIKKTKTGFGDWDQIPSYGGQISDYYQRIWDGFTPLSKSVVFVLASLEFRLTYPQFESFIKTLAKSSEDLSGSWLQIEHLLNPDIDGVSVWHNSFLVYLKALPEFEFERDGLIRKIINWLYSSTDTSLSLLKSFEIPRLRNFLGEPDDLLKISYDWAIQRYLAGADHYQISNIFNEASSKAFELNRLGDFIRLRNIEIRVENSINDLHEHLEGIRLLSLKMRRFQVPSIPRFGRMESYDLKLFLKSLKMSGKIKSFPQKAIDAFNLHLSSDHDYEGKAALNLVQASAVFDDFGFDRLKNFIDGKRNDEAKFKFYSEYFREALSEGIAQNAFELANHSKTEIAWTALVEELVKFQLKVGQNDFKPEIKKLKQKVGPNILADLFMLLEEGTFSSSTIPAQFIPSTLPFADPGSTKFSKGLFLNLLQFFIYQVSGKDEETRSYLDSLGDSFSDYITKVLYEIASIFSENYKANTSIAPFNWLSEFEELPELIFGEGRDLYEFRRSVIPGLLPLIFEFNDWINLKLGEPLKIQNDDIEALLESSWIDNNGVYFILESKCLTDEAFVYLENAVQKELENGKVNIPDRCRLFLCLANLSYNNGKIELASEYLFKSARFIIVHGYHKDLFFGELLAALKKVILKGGTQCESYINKIAPYVIDIGWLTDGDETRSYIHELIEIIAIHDKNRLFPFYLELLSSRDSNALESVFSSIIETADLSNLLELSLARTALEPSALETLKVRAKTDGKALEALESIYSVLGQIDSNVARQDSEGYDSKKKPTGIDYNKIHPSRFDSFFKKNWANSKLNQYEISNRIEEWVKYWSSVSGTDLVLLKAIKNFNGCPLENLTDETWASIFPLALKYDKDFAFECLIWGQAASNDWSYYWTNNPEKYKRRWKPLFQFFPGRAIEFFQESIKRSSLKRGSAGNYFLPLDKGVDFFLDAGLPEVAKNLLEVNLEIIPDLFPEISLTSFPTPTQVGPFEILLSRVQSISPLVRERAAFESAHILSQDQSGQFVYKFIKWLQSQPLETHVCDGLLIAIRSLQLENSLIHNYFKTADLKFNLKGNNILVHLLCNEIRVLLGENEYEFAKSPVSIREPDKKHSKLFGRRLRGHFSPLFSNKLRDINRSVRFDLFDLLKVVFEDKCISKGFDWVIEEDDDYTHAHDFMNCHQTFTGEILKSSYLKVLDILYNQFGMPYTYARSLAIEVLSVDISLWSICSSQIPKNWPLIQSDMKLPSQKNKIFKDDLFARVKSMVSGDIENSILYSEGAIVSASQGDHNSVQAHLRLYSFGYKVNGKHIPSDNELFYFIEKSCQTIIPLSHDSSPWLFPDGSTPIFQDLREFDSGILDLEIFPLVGFPSVRPISYWQFPNKIYPFAFPNPTLFDDLKISKNDRSIEFLDGKGGYIGNLSNFNLGLPYSNQFEGQVRAGTISTMKKEYLEKILLGVNLRLGHVFKLEFHTKETYSSDIQKTKFYQTLNLSPIII
jgi:hypothetical protein